MLNVDEGNYWTLIQLDNQTRKYISKKKKKQETIKTKWGNVNT